MITTQMYYWHDGILEKTDKIQDGASHLVVTMLNGIPMGTFTFIGS